MVKHPWHEVSVGLNPPTHVNGIIEIPKGSRAKYEIDKDSGLIKLDRVLYASMYYPLNYGFIPQTLGEDHDPLDIVVLTQVTVIPGCLIPSKVIGVMRMIDRGEADDKIIAVAEQDVSVSHIDDVDRPVDRAGYGPAKCADLPERRGGRRPATCSVGSSARQGRQRA